MRTDEQERLIKLGDDAAAFIEAPAFGSVIDNLVDGAFHAFVNSKPEEAELRERTYNHYRALVDVVNTLKQHVAVRDQIMESEQAGDSSQEEEPVHE